MKLERELKKQLYEVLLAAFPRPGSLRVLIGLGLGEDALAAIPEGIPTRESIFELITWAEVNEKVEQLVREAVLQNPGNRQLRALADQLARSITPEVQLIPVPIVVAAMTAAEAQQLVSGAVFESDEVTPRQRKDFEAFSSALRAEGIIELSQDYAQTHYGDRREDWRPQLNQASIGELIVGMIGQLNGKLHKKAGSKSLLLQERFVSTLFLAEDPDVQIQTWEQLSSTSYVLIIDAVSWFHPFLRKSLLDSQKGTDQQKVSMVVLPPIRPASVQAVTLAKDILHNEIKGQLGRYFTRFSDEYDLRCEFGVGDVLSMQRWLVAVLDDTVRSERDLRAAADALQAFTEDPAAAGYVNRGVKQLVIGTGNRQR